MEKVNFKIRDQILIDAIKHCHTRREMGVTIGPKQDGVSIRP